MQLAAELADDVKLPAAQALQVALAVSVQALRKRPALQVRPVAHASQGAAPVADQVLPATQGVAPFAMQVLLVSV